MCLILFSWNTRPDFKLVLAANRDEFYRRPTQKAHFWEEAPNILAGKDLAAGGTWMGINKKGKFAAVTNYRNLHKHEPSPYYKTRGKLVADYLKDEIPPLEYLNNIHEQAGFYDGFNLILGDFENLFYYSNIGKKILQLEAGIYGLSNDQLDTPWPKVVKGKKLLDEQLYFENISDENLLNMLYNVDHAKHEALPDTGVGIDFERELSPMFIKMNAYGTRSSTLLKISRDGEYIFRERIFEKGEIKEEVKKSLKV